MSGPAEIRTQEVPVPEPDLTPEAVIGRVMLRDQVTVLDDWGGGATLGMNAAAIAMLHRCRCTG